MSGDLELTLASAHTSNSDVNYKRSIDALARQLILRVFRSLGCRCECLDCNPSCDELLNQLAMRSVYLQNSTLNSELLALRTLTSFINAEFKRTKELGYYKLVSDVLANFIILPEWFERLTWSQISKFDIQIKQATHESLRKYGENLLDQMSRDRENNYLEVSKKEWGLILAGLGMQESKIGKRIDRDEWEPIGICELNAVLSVVPDGSPEDGLLGIARNCPSYFGLTRLLAKSAWLTGMRSVELFSCQLLFLEDSHAFVKKFKDHDCKDFIVPKDFGEQCELNSIDAASIEHGKQVLQYLQLQLTPVLFIRSAKIANSSAAIDNIVRLQILEGINPSDLEDIWMTTQLRKLLISRQRKNSIRDKCSGILHKASHSAFPERVNPITLHTLRHAFIDEARKIYPLAELLALSGHTSIVTNQGYGGKLTRYSSSNSAGRWMPMPDPVQSVKIHKALELSVASIEPCENDNMPPDNGLNSMATRQQLLD